MSFCYKKILGVFTHLRVTTPNIIEPLSTDGCRVFTTFYYKVVDRIGTQYYYVVIHSTKE